MTSSMGEDKSEMNEDELFYLMKWHNFQKNVSIQFERLREEEDLVDITFACEGRQIRAHKLVLFACSPYFKQLLKSNPCKHPVFFMNDVKFEILKAILEYMYLGEVHVSNDNLKEFMRVAESLKIRGLSKDKDRLLSSSLASHIEQHMDFDADISEEPQMGQNPLGRKHKMMEEVTPAEEQQRPKCAKTEKCMNEGMVPKVEMVELFHESHHAPTYCNIQTLLIGTPAQSGDKTLTTIAVPPTNTNPMSHPPNQAPPNPSDVMTQTDHKAQMPTEGPWMDKPGAVEQNPSGNVPTDKCRVKGTKANCLSPHPCPVCSRLYSNVSNLRQHMRLIHNPTAVVCNMCQKTFNSQLYLKRHISSVHGYAASGQAGGGGNVTQEREDSKPPATNPQQHAQPNTTTWNIYETMENPSSIITQPFPLSKGDIEFVNRII
ncbi:protein bric-a-brac 2-like isoform X2 [Phlebotomus papatasi]|uniref:protein bric-a-brac 2-like isoform X2 n=1 Tax=Phlebotomus papatasi TaxID=29031 RepID=UPI002483B2BB|nr:protein bric-a-brac 2-like isoform X2 [Phlebotomus papatasi]